MLGFWNSRVKPPKNVLISVKNINLNKLIWKNRNGTRKIKLLKIIAKHVGTQAKLKRWTYFGWLWARRKSQWKCWYRMGEQGNTPFFWNQIRRIKKVKLFNCKNYQIYLKIIAMGPSDNANVCIVIAGISIVEHTENIWKNTNFPVCHIDMWCMHHFFIHCRDDCQNAYSWHLEGMFNFEIIFFIGKKKLE